MQRPRFVVADTMDLWLNTALKDLLRLLRRVDMFVLNDSEARQLTREDNVVVALRKIHQFGPRYVIIKKGEHGALLSGPEGFFVAPAYPLARLVDPTGAGDSFVGGIVGYLAARGGDWSRHIRKAIVCGSALASFCCEGFGIRQTSRLDADELNARVAQLESMARF
jgi:sugar/nucleoside kinase (ribokinase family)